MHYIGLFLLLAISCFAMEPCEEEPVPEKVAWKNKVRVEVLRNLDEFLSWRLDQLQRSYALSVPALPLVFRSESAFMRHFELLHGFFSLYQPLVGRVTSYLPDLKQAQCVLKGIALQMSDRKLQQFAADELLVKVLAYRDLHVNEVWLLPMDGGADGLRLIPYQIDVVFNLWMGMPAYGFVPLEEGVPLLLFRGTDFSLDSPRGWASLMSDVDLAGPGLYTFQQAQSKIHAWLQKMADRGTKARTMGYSLGGVLAAYAFIFEQDLLAERGSVAFNLPGVSNQIIEKWEALPKERKEGFVSFVNQGDVVSKVGKLFGVVYELSLNEPMKPLTAHTILMSAQPEFIRRGVDVAAENQLRAKRVMSMMDSLQLFQVPAQSQ